MLRQQLAAALDPVRADHAPAILVEGHPALGLAPIRLDHRRDRAHAGKRGVEHGRVDPLLARLAAQLGQPCLRRIGGGSEGDDRQRQGTEPTRPSAVRRSDGRMWRTVPVSLSAIA